MNLRLINSFCFFLLIVCPLTASAACPPGGKTEVVEGTGTMQIVLLGAHFSQIHICNNIDKNKCIYDSCNTATKVEQYHISKINQKPQCQPVGQLARQCVDHEIVSAIPTGNGCAVEWEFTVCAYSPFQQGILNDKSLGIKKKPATRQRGPRSRSERGPRSRSGR